ncbi:MAG: hypothetical protein ABC360_06735 [Acetomicrobium sp.]
MDLASDNNNWTLEDPWPKAEGYRVLLLPGSRQNAYRDVRLLLNAAELIREQVRANFLMVIAPSIEWDRMASSLDGYSLENGFVKKGEMEVLVSFCPVPAAARRADILLGLGGTANQVCAGLGVPVVSIDDKGKGFKKGSWERRKSSLKGIPKPLPTKQYRFLGIVKDTKPCLRQES